MRRSVLLSLILLLPVPVFAQWYAGKPITEIRFEGLSSVSENELSGLVRPYTGEPYTDSLSWEIQGKLYALDYFELIVPEIRPAAPGNEEQIVLVFLVEEKPLVDSIVFTGNNKVRRGDLADAVLIKNGDFLNPGSLRADEQAVLDLYLEKGFIEAQVSSEAVVDEQSNTASVTFSITEGNQTKISEIRFTGNNSQITDTTLRNLMQTKEQSLFSKGLFVETKLQEDIKAIERYYADQGYADAVIPDINKEIVFDTEENLNKMIITIVIDEGSVWTYGGMSFIGNHIYTDEELDRAVLQEPGAVFSDTLFQTDFQRVQDLYFENGYIFNTVDYEEIRDFDSQTISFAVNIVERDRAHIENIVIRGNTKTKSYVIRREIPLEEGEVFSRTKIYEGIMNLYNLQYFDIVEPQPLPGSSDGLMDLIVDVSEGQTTDVSAGLSFSGGPDFPISGQVTFNDRNFLGRGQTLGVEGSISRDSRGITLSFTEPRIFVNRWSGSIDAGWNHDTNRYINQDLDGNGIPDPYMTWEEYDAAGRIIPEDHQMEYKSHNISTGFGTGYTWLTRLGRLGLSTGMRFSWENVKYDVLAFRPHSQDLRENLETWKYDDNISLRMVWDTRDLQFDPTSGFILSQRLTFAGLLPSSRRDHIKSSSRFNYNYTLIDRKINSDGDRFRSILYLNSAFQALLDKPWTDSVADRQRDGFYIDGMFIARGWDASSGYKYLWDNTVQLKFPIVPNMLAFDVFLDAVGSWVTTDSQFETGNALKNMHINDWRFSLGAGFRFANAQFPIGLYLVKKFQWDFQGNLNWNPEPDFTEFRNWGMDLVVAFNFDIY